MLNEQLDGRPILLPEADSHSGIEDADTIVQERYMIVLGEPSLDVRGGDVTADVSDIISEGPLSLRMGNVMGKLARRNPGWCVMRVARVGCGVGNLLTREHDQIERERETARHPERVLDMLR